MHCLLPLSCQVVTSGYTNLHKAADLFKLQLKAADLFICVLLLLPPRIKGLNSHKNHSIISTLTIDSIKYFNVILKIYHLARL